MLDINTYPLAFIINSEKYFEEIFGMSSDEVTVSMLANFIEIGEPSDPTQEEKDHIFSEDFDFEEDFDFGMEEIGDYILSRELREGNDQLPSRRRTLIRRHF